MGGIGGYGTDPAHEHLMLGIVHPSQRRHIAYDPVKVGRQQAAPGEGNAFARVPTGQNGVRGRPGPPGGFEEPLIDYPCA
ncbi:hypothetical protein AD944_01770 [Acetobacter tropicalis]|nr:hypothetical protein AD944_01770 [Acetobacter tropicalis]